MGQCPPLNPRSSSGWDSTLLCAPYGVCKRGSGPYLLCPHADLCLALHTIQTLPGKLANAQVDHPPCLQIPLSLSSILPLSLPQMLSALAWACLFSLPHDFTGSKAFPEKRLKEEVAAVCEGLLLSGPDPADLSAAGTCDGEGRSGHRFQGRKWVSCHPLSTYRQQPVPYWPGSSGSICSSLALRTLWCWGPIWVPPQQ